VNGPAADRELHGLCHASRRRPAVLQRLAPEYALPNNPLGIKGCGEAGAIGSPPALMNAITDAIGNNRPDHARHAREGLGRLCACDTLRRNGHVCNELSSRVLGRGRRQTQEPASDEGRYLSGGMTLIPTMKQRLAAPSDLIDLRHIPDLKGISLDGGNVRIGAATPHADVAGSSLLRSVCPAICDLAGMIGDPHVRHMGTIGGSIANNDPAADYPAAMLGLGRRSSPIAGGSERTISSPVSSRRPWRRARW
jgi:hypothetical protein